MPADFVKEYNEELKRKAKKEGKAEGREEGREEGIFEVAKALLKENIPLKTIMKATNLSKEDIESLK